MITLKEFYERVIELEEEYGDEYIGIRWEEKPRTIGEELDNSRHNLERLNESDMPEYGTPEYEEMFELDGASSLGTYTLLEDLKRDYKNRGESLMNSFYTGTHCYVIVGTDFVNESDGLDEGEVVVKNAKVMEVLY